MKSIHGQVGKLTCGLSVFGCCLILPSLSLAQARWSVAAGPAWRSGGNLSLALQPQELSALVRTPWGSEYSRDADLPGGSGYADRDYDNGFVYRDPGTADPETYIPGLTWNWGYESGGQYNGSSIRFDLSGESRTHTVDLSPIRATTYEEDQDLAGVEVALLVEWPLAESNCWSYGVQGALTVFGEESLAFAEQQQLAEERFVDRRYRDYYTVNGYTPPPAPYAGSYEGPGPLLNNVPDDRRSRVVRDDRRTWYADLSLDADIQQTEFRLGPTFSGYWLERVKARISPVLVMALVDAEAVSTLRISSSEQVDQRVETTRDDQNEVLYAPGLDLSGGLRIWRSCFVELSALYTWWQDSVALQPSPYRFDYEPGEWAWSAKVAWEF